MARINESKGRFWSGHIRGWQSSGLSRRGYCLREGLSLSSFEYWRRRRSCKADGMEAESALTLVPVCVETGGRDGSWLLRSPTGWSLSLPASVSAEFLADVLKQLP